MAKNSLVFNLIKVIHFFQKATFPNPKVILLPLPYGNRIVKSKIIKLMVRKISICWLEIYFDFYFFFDFLEKMASKRYKAASGLSMLIKTIKKIQELII